jgi:hypothetical protein
VRTAFTLLLVGLLPIGAATAERHSSAGQTMTYCGGETDVASIERYFADLRQALAKARPKTRFNMFVADEFGVSSKQGRLLYFKVRDIGSVTPSYITVREWHEISRRGARSLIDAGWRGCFMDNGKVWLSGSRETGFQLTQISKDMPWLKPADGTTMKLAHPAN